MSKKFKTSLAAILFGLVVMTVCLFVSAGESPVNTAIVINEVVTQNSVRLFGRDKQPWTWFEIKNITAASYDLSQHRFYIEGASGMWNLPARVLKPGEILLVYTSGLADPYPGEELHSSVKPAPGNKMTLVIAGPSGPASRLSVPKLPDNISYGRTPAGMYAFYVSPTPGAENSTTPVNSLDSVGMYATDASPVRINEYSTGRQRVVFDEDGDYPDFIELYNDSDEPVNLDGWLLSDGGVAKAHSLSGVSLLPRGFLLLFASGKDPASSGVTHLPFKLSAGETLSLYNPKGYLVDLVLLAATSDDASRGRGLEDPSVWFYYPSPTPGYPNSTQGYADNGEASARKGAPLVISEILTANSRYSKAYNGRFYDYIELYNRTDGDLDLTGMYLSDSRKDTKKWAFPTGAAIPAGSYLVVYASGLDGIDRDGFMHTGFKLSKSSECVILSQSTSVIDYIDYGKLTADVSIGLGDTDFKALSLFQTPTPGAPNEGPVYSGLVMPVGISPSSGVYGTPVTVSLSCATYGSVIRYTLDGSVPGPASSVYSAPLTVSSTTVVRAAAFVPGAAAGEVRAATFVFGQPDSTLPAFFIEVDPASFRSMYFSPLHSARAAYANMQFIDGDGGFNQTVRLQKHGNMSSLLPQRSMKVSFSEIWGDSSLEYDLFPDDARGVSSFKSFILRTSGNDWNALKCKDGLVALIASASMDVDYMAYRPSVVYVNGEYYGIYNIRDQLNKNFLASHYGVDPDNVDIISFGYGIHSGDYAEYNRLLSFLRNNNLSDEANWAKVNEMIDVDNFIDTYLCHIYYSNFDTVNIKWWREKKDGAKWRWFLYDLDYAFYIPSQNNLKIVTNPAGHGVNNYFPSDQIYYLMKSRQFRARFLERLSGHWKDAFNSDYIMSRFEETYAVIAPEIERSFRRWNISSRTHTAEVAEFDDFLRRRPDYFRSQVKSYFGLSTEELDRLLPKQTVTHPKLVPVKW